ncbi:MAG: hypothetical protein HZA95_01950 [Candidatus Vogelbacteria bacterium]|nr:hypothetical protein [Candidatus Vogelbacteria bacterium]
MAPISVPLIVIFFAYKTWQSYLRAQFIASTKWVTLEIRLPKEIVKTPIAMELVLNAFNQPGEGEKYYEQIFKGQVRLWSSLEIVSINGKVKFMVHIPAKFRNGVEAQFYAQYPGIEIREVEDYVQNVNYLDTDNDWQIQGADLVKDPKKPSILPLKTYYDYYLSLDKNPKEEFKTDPIASLIEIMGSIPADHQMWLQILIMASKSKWKDEAEEAIKKLYEPDKEKFKTVSPQDREKAEVLNRLISKPAFDVGIRAIYAAKNDRFDKALAGLVGALFSPFNAPNYNALKGKSTSVNYPWKDWSGIRVSAMKRRMYDRYRKRSFFYDDRVQAPCTMSAEELATIWHLPGAVVGSPALDRIESKSSEAPVNIPI